MRASGRGIALPVWTRLGQGRRPQAALSLTYSSFVFNRRKNHLFAGSDAGGHRVAATYSLIETAKLNGLKPLHYMADEFVRIPDHPAQITDERPG